MFARPVALAEAFDRLEAGGRLLAGGTDLMVTAGEAGFAGALIDISRLPELRGVTPARGEIRIGAATTWAEIARADLPPGFAALKAAAREIGAIQIQTRGTIGGNLCNASPAADGVPPLLALGAEVEIAARHGVRRLPLPEFLAGPRRTRLEPGEIVVAVVAPAPPPGLRSCFLKLGARRYLVISIVMVALALDIEGEAVREARVAVGACSPVALRLPDAERRLVGLRARAGFAGALRAEDFNALAPIADLRADAHYRRDAALTLTRRAAELCLSHRAGGAI